MKRSCQRHTQVFDLPVRRMISLVPTPSALNRTTLVLVVDAVRHFFG
jgi:hypothetical protein